MGNNRHNMAMGGDELPDVSWDDWDGLQDPSTTVWGGARRSCRPLQQQRHMDAALPHSDKMLI